MKNKKQNSIDWFINHLIKCGHNLSAHKLEIQQAKQMHKEEIISEKPCDKSNR